LVIVKGCWRMSDGRLAPAEQQVSLYTQPLRYRLGDLELDAAQQKTMGKRLDDEIVWLDHDLSPPKPAFDVLVAGYVTAPPEYRHGDVDASVRIGRKTIAVRAHVPRYWRRGWFGYRATPLAPVVRRVPLTYAVADWPEGFPLVAQDDAPAWLPWIESPKHASRRGKHARTPAGLGFWPENAAHRLPHAGTYDAVWQQEIAPDLPRDFDPQFYNVAHPDAQLPSAPAPGTPIRLVHLAEQPVIECVFPALDLCVQATTAAGEMQAPEALRPDTLILEPDHNRLSVIWRLLLPAGRERSTLRSVRLFKPDHRQA
jgi:hypothetical protein